ncbi:probable G-protein coupled receptor 139 isoform X2 [Narcine bancroftii]|uniref:probable G-protein coupled receptor 139 isoform X2 n=1 Tax=Narcine bancroftii TaxID=1343680 RepID=UPI003831DF81
MSSSVCHHLHPNLQGNCDSHKYNILVTPRTFIRRDYRQYNWVFISVKKTMRELYYSVEVILYVIIAFTGIPVNVMAIAILSRGKCGLCKCTTFYLVAMATADLFFIILEAILFRINDRYFHVSFLYITTVSILRVVFMRVARDFSVWFTVWFTVDRFIAICFQKLKTKYCSRKTAVLILSTSGVVFILKNIPFYFTVEPGNVTDNVPWFIVVKPSYYTDVAWRAFDWFDTLLTPLIPFTIILLLNSLTVRHIIMTSRVRKALRGQSRGVNHNDPEMESRRRSMVLLFTLSGCFIILWVTAVAHFLYYQITGTGGQWNDSEYIFYEVSFLLSNLNCCTNTFIYVVTQSKFREQLKSALKYLVTSILHFVR